MGLFFPIYFIQVFASSKGLSQNVAFYTLAVLNAGSVFGRVLPNFLADKYGPFNLLIPCVIVSAALQWIMLACGSAGGVMAFSAIYGFFSGAYVSLLPSVLISFARGLHEIGVRMGLPFVLIAIGALIGSPICGTLIGSSDFVWWKGATFAGVCILVGSALLMYARMLQAKRKGTQIV